MREQLFESYRKFKYFLLIFVFCSVPVLANTVNYIETQVNGQNGVTGLSGISDVAVSPDGKFVYTASYASNAVSVFERNPETGQVTYRSTVTGIAAAFSVDVSSDNKSVYAASPIGGQIYAYTRDLTTGALTLANSLSGAPTSGFVSVSVSPDSKTVYGVGGQPSGLVVFGRDMETSAITRVADYADNSNGYLLGQYFGPVTSPIKNIASTADGQFVYVTSTADNALTLFSRDATTGALTQLVVYQDGVAGVDGLQSASSVKMAPDGKHLYVTGQGESSVAIFGVDESSGELTYIDKVTNGVDDIANLVGARSLAISPDGRYVLVSAITSDSVTAFSRDAATGLLTLDSVVTNAVNGVSGLDGPSGMATDPLNRHLYVAGQLSHSLVVFSLPTPAVKLSVNTAAAVVFGSAVTLDPQLEVFDSDSPDLVSATITINSGFINTDALAVQATAGITAAYDSATGVLTLSGVAPLADYQAVLRSLSYQAGADPSLDVGDSSTRQINIQVSDGENTSAVVTVTVTVEKTNGFIVTFVDWDNAVLSSQLIVSGGAATAPTAPNRTGYGFTGWDLAFDNVTSDLTVVAQYSINTYTVTFDLDGGSHLGGGALTQTIDYGLAATVPVFAVPVGTTFAGWSSSFDTVTADLTVTALYNISQYTLTFNSAGGSAIAPVTANFGTAITAPADPTREGYIFTGWSPVLPATMPASNTTVTAQWTEVVPYTVSVTVSGNGSISPASQQVQAGQTAVFALTLTNPEDYVSLSSSCAATLSGNNLVTAAINADCSIAVAVYPSNSVEKSTEAPLSANGSASFTLAGGAGAKSLNQVSQQRAGSLTVLSEQDAQALLTEQADGSYLFSASRTGRYTLEFIDAVSGEVVAVTFDVLPYLAFTSDRQPVQQDAAATLRIWLSDEPIDYPVTAILTGTGATVSETTVLINAQDALRKAYSVTATAESASVALTLAENSAALPGTPDTHTLVVQQEPPALALTVSAVQNDTETLVITQTAGVVSLSAAERKGISASYSWSVSGITLDISGATASFEPATLAEGRYLINVSAEAEGRSGQYELALRVIAACPENDCAGTGIPASANRFAGIPNRLPICPAVAEGNRVGSCQENTAQGLYAEVPNLYTLTLGTVTEEQSWNSGQFGVAVTSQSLEDEQHTQLGAVVNFDIIGLENPGEAVPVAIPLLPGVTIPQGAVWRKYLNGQWQDFVEDDANHIDSAARNALGLCPGVSSDVWTAGLTAGHSCIRLTIEDGGPNDDDAEANSVIRDPGVLATPVEPQPEPVKEAKVKSGGSMGGIMILLSGALVLLRTRKVWLTALLLPLSVSATNLYVGAEVLSANSDTNSGKVTQTLNNLGIGGTATIADKRREGIRLFGGYPVTDTLTVELGWLDLGEVTTHFSGIAADTELRDLARIWPTSGKGVELSLLWQPLTLAERIKPGARFGLWRMQSKDRFVDAVETRLSDTEIVPFIELLGEYVLNEAWSVKLGISQYAVDSADIRTVQLGAIWRF